MARELRTLPPGSLATLGMTLLALAACARPHADDATLLRAQLASMRHAIAAYRAQEGRPPKTLGDLVSAHLLTAIPVDPITGSVATWKTDTEETVAVNDDFREPVQARNGAPAAPGIIDVHSGAPGRDDAGKPWAEY